MTAAEVASHLIGELENAGVPIVNECYGIDTRRNIVVEWDGGSSIFFGSLNKTDMMQRIKHSVQNHVKFYIKRTSKKEVIEDGDGQ